MAWLTLADLTPAGGGNYFVSPANMTTLLAQHGSWQGDVNANSKTLSNVVIDTSHVGTFGSVHVSASASVARGLVVYSGVSARISLAVSGAESTGNVGSNFALQCYNDAGAYLLDAMQVERATGAVKFPQGVASLTLRRADATEGGQVDFDDATCGYSLDVAAGQFRLIKFAGTGPAVPLVIDTNGEVGVQGILKMANANGERIRVYDSGGINHAIGVEPSCMWQQVSAGSLFRWYCGATPDNGVSYNMQLEPAHLRLQASTEMDLDFICYAGGTNAKLSRITAAPGSIAFQLLNDTYTAGLSSFSLYTTYCAASVPMVHTTNTTNSDSALTATGQWHVYAPSNTQLVFRMRGSDGVVRQGTVNLS